MRGTLPFHVEERCLAAFETGASEEHSMSTQSVRPPFPRAGLAHAAAAVLVRNWWLVLLRGILGVAFGIIALVHPGSTMLSLAMLFSAWLLVDGLFAIGSAMRGHERWGFLLLQGFLSILAAGATIMSPGITL